MMTEALMVQIHLRGVIFPINTLRILVCPFSVIYRVMTTKERGGIVKCSAKGLVDRVAGDTFDMIPQFRFLTARRLRFARSWRIDGIRG